MIVYIAIFLLFAVSEANIKNLSSQAVYSTFSCRKIDMIESAHIKIKYMMTGLKMVKKKKKNLLKFLFYILPNNDLAVNSFISFM